MSKIHWDKPGFRFFETGVDRCVLYSKNPDTYEYDNGVAWNGVTSISESDNGYQLSPIYANNHQYLILASNSDPSISLEAYTYPEEFAECEGSVEITTGMHIHQQNRKEFGLSYRTLVGNDIFGTDYGYEIHIVYGCLAQPSDRSNTTINDSPEAINFSWNITTSPVPFRQFKPVSVIVIDSTKIIPEKLYKLESILYGTNFENPRLPLPEELYNLIMIDPIDIMAMGDNEEIGNVVVHDVQSNVVVWGSSITGTLKPQPWLLDPFSTVIGSIDNQNHYYLALDFSNNDFGSVTNCYVGIDENSMYNVFADEDKKVLVEVDREHPYLILMQIEGGQTYTQYFKLSTLTFSDL